jgi:hypothetical protein
MKNKTSQSSTGPQSGNAAVLKSAENRKRQRVGLFVFISLVSLKIIEFAIANLWPAGNWPYMVILAFVSAGLIIYYYKHISRLWRIKGKTHE